MVKYEMLRQVKYGLSNVREGLSAIRDAVWSCFVQTVQLWCFTMSLQLKLILLWSPYM